MVIRKKALTQVIGLVTMENGIYLAAVAATRGLPLAVEFGVALDVLTGVAVMGAGHPRDQPALRQRAAWTACDALRG